MTYQVYYWRNGSLVLDREYRYRSSLLKYLSHDIRKGFLVRCDLGCQVDWYQYDRHSYSGLGYADNQSLDEFIQEK